MPRMRILNAVEQEAFDSPPEFTSAQRKQHFDFPIAVRQLAQTLRTPTNRACFLVSCGYFKAAKRFFLPSTFRVPDLEYVARHAGFSVGEIDIHRYDKSASSRHQRLIAEIYGFRGFDDAAQAFLAGEIEAMIRSQLKPRLVFWRSVDLLIREKIVVPGYFRLAELILSAINDRRRALSALVETQLSEELRSLLDELFVQNAAGEHPRRLPMR